MRYLRLALFLLVTLGGGLAIGAANLPGEWYAGLQKPWFNPPNWLFGPAWTLLYILVAIAGWRVCEAGRRAALGVWVLQLGLNFAWSPLFFGHQMIGAGLVVILLMLAAILAFIALTWRNQRWASLCFLPYAAWVAFAGLLNGAIFWLN